MPFGFYLGLNLNNGYFTVLKLTIKGMIGLMKKVMFVDHDSHHSGSTVSLEYILAYFVKKEYKVSLLTAKPLALKAAYSENGISFQSIGKFRINPLFLDLHITSPKADFSLISVKRFLAFILQIFFGILIGLWHFFRAKPDLVYINEYVSLHLGIAAKILGIPVIMHVRSCFTLGHLGIRPYLIRKFSKFESN